MDPAEVTSSEPLLPTRAGSLAAMNNYYRTSQRICTISPCPFNAAKLLVLPQVMPPCQQPYLLHLRLPALPSLLTVSFMPGVLDPVFLGL